MYASIHAIRAIEFLETQGFLALKTHIEGLWEKGKKRSTPGLKMILEDPRFARVASIVNEVVGKEIDHPKVT